MSRRSRKRAALDAKANGTADDRKITDRRTCAGQRKPPWVAPDDMPQDMVDKVRAGKLCGARRANGEYCRMRPESHQRLIGRSLPYRCKFHGGAVPYGCLPKGFKPNLKHGVYSRSVLPGEEDTFKELRRGAGAIDEEIAVCKLRLARAIRQEMLQHEADRIGLEEEQLEVKKSERSHEDDGKSYKVRRSRVLERRNWGQIIHKIVLELSKLYGIKAGLEGEDLGADERAAMARAALALAKASVTGKKEE